MLPYEFPQEDDKMTNDPNLANYLYQCFHYSSQHNIATARVSCSTNPGVIFNLEAGDDCDWREPDGLPVNERTMLVSRSLVVIDLVITRS